MQKYLINVPSNRERREFALSRLVKVGLHTDLAIIDAYNPSSPGFPDTSDASPSAKVQLTEGEIGCAQSHINILKEIVDKKIPGALIFEDDVCFVQNPKRIHRILANIPADAELAMLHAESKTAVTDGRLGLSNEHFNRAIIVSFITVCYYVSLEGARKILHFGTPFNQQIDLLYRILSDKLVCYQAKGSSAIAMQNHWFPSQVRVRTDIGKIPKIVHTAWFGGNIPQDKLNVVMTWKKHHPDHEIRIWSDESARAEFGDEPFRYCRNPAQKADVFRYLLLNRIGGIWVDTDMECLKPFYKILQRSSFIYGEQRQGEPAIGLLASVPGHSLSKILAENAVEASTKEGGIDSTTGPGYLQRCLGSVYSYQFDDMKQLLHNGKVLGHFLGDSGITALAQWAVYPYWMNEKWEPKKHPEAFAVHHWDKSWW